jgi:hypothetical protein
VSIRGPLAWIVAIALLLSLALNVLIAGFVLGRLHGGPENDFDHLVGFIVRPYPPEIQHAIRDGARDHRAELGQRLDALRDARRQAFEAGRANPFDAAKLQAAQASVRAAVTAMQQTVHGIEADAIAHATPDTRRQIKPPHGPFP